MSEHLVEEVLGVVAAIPPGQVVTYGDIAALVGTGPRQVGQIMAAHGATVPWWRVVNHAGELPVHLMAEAKEHWAAEGIALKPNGRGCRITQHRDVGRGPTMGGMRIIFAGTPEVAVPSLRALLASEHEVLAVVTRPDAPKGRGKKLLPSPVAEVASEAGVEVLKPTHPRDPEFQDRLAELAPDCVPVVAYGALVPPAALAIPRHGWVNLHFSLLPRWRGAAPVQRAIMAGDTETGACVFQLVEELDAGAVFGRIERTIAPTDTAGELLDALAREGADLLVRTLDDIAAGTATAEEQPVDGVTLAPKLTVAEGRIDWNGETAAIDRQVRGCSPAPGAWTTLRGERFKVHTATCCSDAADTTARPGELLVDKKRVRVATGDGVLELGTVQPPGKKAMRAADWARGAGLEPHERFDA